MCPVICIQKLCNDVMLMSPYSDHEILHTMHTVNIDLQFDIMIELKHAKNVKWGIIDSHISHILFQICQLGFEE